MSSFGQTDWHSPRLSANNRCIMALTLQKVIDEIEMLAPVALAEPWDCVGLQVGSVDMSVGRVLLAVDVTRQVVSEATRKHADAIIAHHPVLFDRVSSLRPDRWPGCVLAPLIAAGKGLYVAHTNLDAAPATNTSVALAHSLGLGEVMPLLAPKDDDAVGLATAGEVAGIGVIARGATRPLAAWMDQAREALGIASVRFAESGNEVGTRVAIIAGSAKSMLPDLIRVAPDLLIAGEIGHHMAVEAASTGISSIEVGHFASEHPAMVKLRELLTERLGSIDFTLSDDPNGAFCAH